ncbi:hypothetical protein [Campylobacter aviculae]|uniref:Uncharacterized protein n=1 Tax=Campylobacter aviculae TaxID=2510190 RepID=A0A4U7BR50_9BACT|nr:hypothetical protein [Campylobacter aviculae]TKX32835.1 hypothetical protein CQA76_02455 [Campylobacter aviculae]
MNWFENFQQEYQKGFWLHNYYDDIFSLEKKLNHGKMLLQKDENNFFFYENQKLYFFIQNNKKFNLKPSYTGIIIKNDRTLIKYQEFLEKNNFKIHQNFLQMSRGGGLEL